MWSEVERRSLKGSRWKYILSSLASHVRNFQQQIHQTSFAETDVMVSFEVVSLFTNVPVDEALQAISS